jgi:sugar/nucleoside kinase (ribokinase family)
VTALDIRWDLLGFGAVAVDDLIYVDHFPAPDTKIPVRERRREGGGLAGTALVAAARLGARVAYCGVLGDDELSRFSIEELEREGVDCSPILRRAGARPYHSTVIVDVTAAQRTILFSADGVTPRRAGEMMEDLIGRCRVLFVDQTAVEGGLRAVELAHARGISAVGDFEREGGPHTHALMRQVDHLILGMGFAAQITGESDPAAIVRALAGPDRACCAVTVGERGCWYSARGGAVQHVPAFAVQVADTTGCGDVFHGAYAACIARGEAVAQAIRFASAAAALKATRLGGRSGIPDRAAVEAFLAGRAQGARG